MKRDDVAPGAKGLPAIGMAGLSAVLLDRIRSCPELQMTVHVLR
ncbi:hypothetical protein D3OALGA1CA_1007 [Olavius algarvensis associated proteobacterium Delta 3]|nr:hypothetical protein D3OALGA1CA_1007 [Olavius algarvensis associated proteobacterium Delta 3]CAB5130512.1 hypothetical protein D3OALGB2SA_3596 [Olavius algarvensis associated proteobacterium Delta 3]